MTGPCQYTPYIWPMLASPALLLVLAAYAWRHRAVPGARPFVALWRRCPNVLPIGVDMLEHRAVVFSERSSRARTTDDLLRVIESGIGSGVKGDRS